VENEKVCQERHQQKKKKKQQQQQQKQVEAKEEALKEKEAHIAFKSEQLKEASRLNLEKEREIRERMSALDAVSRFHTSLLTRTTMCISPSRPLTTTVRRISIFNAM
jgi:hypothetical protein